MGTYLGEVSIIKGEYNDFINFKPYYAYENGAFSVLSRFDRQALLPESELENINFYSSDPNCVIKDEFHSHEYYLLEFDTEDLEDNVNYQGVRNRTGYKIDVSQIAKNKLRSLYDIGLYRFIKAESITGDYRTNPILIVNDSNTYEGMMVVLELHGIADTVLGPFRLDLRTMDDQLIIKTNFQNNKYLIPAVKFLHGINNGAQTFGLYESEQKYVNVTDATCEKQWVDVIPRDILLKSFRDALESDAFENGRLNLENINSLVSEYAASYLIGDGIPTEIQNKRLEDLRTMLTDEENLNDTFGFIGDTIADLLLKYKDKEEFSPILQRIANDPQFMGQIQRFEIVNNKIAEKEAELQDLTSHIGDLQQQKENEENSSTAEEIIGDKRAELDAIQDEIKTLNDQLALAREGISIQGRLEQLNEDVDYKEKREHELNSKIKTIEDKLDGIFDNSTEKALSFAFDGMLSNRMLQTAADWESKQQQQDYAAVISAIKENTPAKLEKEELIAYLCDQVGKYRPTYGKNAILNIFICVTQSFLSVFSGEPGTGKTSICNIIANTLGLTTQNERIPHIENSINANRFISISVERGWTSKRDFIGYYNPLTKQFDRSNSRIYDGLNIMDIEAKGNPTDLPYIILLDEANLSPMEYYWADFMNICDDLGEYSMINIGEDYRFQIPSCLRFMATINNDHTTEALSPRLIDRAWVIRLPAVKNGVAKGTKLNMEGVKPILWSSLVDAFDVDMERMVQISGTAKEVYEAVLAQLKAAKIHVSPRADIAIRRYWSVAQAVFEDNSGFAVDASIVALDYAVAQRILPHINGSGEQFGKDLRSLAKICGEKNLLMSAETLDEIIRKGDDSMSYYQYFA